MSKHTSLVYSFFLLLDESTEVYQISIYIIGNSDIIYKWNSSIRIG